MEFTFRYLVMLIQAREEKLLKLMENVEELRENPYDWEHVLEVFRLSTSFEKAVYDYDKRKNKSLSAYYFITGVLSAMLYFDGLSLDEYDKALDILFDWELDDNPGVPLMFYKQKLLGEDEND